jgi:sugar O-acyltransferase (sialic acid O-acetyltransferase NeuD family)
MSTPRKLVIVGAGGAGLEALLVARRMGTWAAHGFADDAPELAGRDIDGVAVLGAVDRVASELSHQGFYAHLAVGRNTVRRKWAALFESRGFLPATLIDPSAVLAASASIGEGSYLAPHVFVGPEAKVGRHVLVNVGASIGHHSVVEDFGQVCPGGCVSGNARLEKGAFIGSNGVVAPGVRIGAWAAVGAASLAARDVPDHFSAVGVPARLLRVPASPEPN